MLFLVVGVQTESQVAGSSQGNGRMEENQGTSSQTHSHQQRYCLGMCMYIIVIIYMYMPVNQVELL